MFLSRGDRDHGDAFQTHPVSQASARGKQRILISSWVAIGISWSPLSGLQGVKPPVEFGERTPDCSPGYAIKESPHLAMTWTSRGFNPAGAPRCVSHEVQWRAQGASRAAPGKSGLHARGEGERVIALESC